MQGLWRGRKQEDSPWSLYKKELDPQIFSLALYSQGLLLLYHLADDRFTLWRDLLIPAAWSIARIQSLTEKNKAPRSHIWQTTASAPTPETVNWQSHCTADSRGPSFHRLQCGWCPLELYNEVALGEPVSFCPPSSHLRPCNLASNRKQRGKIIDAHCNSNSSLIGQNCVTWPCLPKRMTGKP